MRKIYRVLGTTQSPADFPLCFYCTWSKEWTLNLFLFYIVEISSLRRVLHKISMGCDRTQSSSSKRLLTLSLSIGTAQQNDEQSPHLQVIVPANSILSSPNFVHFVRWRYSQICSENCQGYQNTLSRFTVRVGNKTYILAAEIMREEIQTAHRFFSPLIFGEKAGHSHIAEMPTGRV